MRLTDQKVPITPGTPAHELVGKVGEVRDRRLARREHRESRLGNRAAVKQASHRQAFAVRHKRPDSRGAAGSKIP
jgi:hypothetical protein